MARHRVQIVDQYAARFVRLDHADEADRLALIFRDQRAAGARLEFGHARLPVRVAFGVDGLIQKRIRKNASICAEPASGMHRREQRGIGGLSGTQYNHMVRISN